MFIGYYDKCFQQSKTEKNRIVVNAWQPIVGINKSAGIKRVLLISRENIIKNSKENLYIFAAGNKNVDAKVLNGTLQYKYDDKTKQYTLDKLDNLIIVAGYKNILTLYNSNYGESIDIAAPIVNSSTIMNNEYTNKFGGTSSSSALVGGVASLIYSINKELTPKDVKAMIVNSATEYITEDSKGKTLDKSIPILDAKLALELALETVKVPSIIKINDLKPSHIVNMGENLLFSVKLSGNMKKGYSVYLNISDDSMLWEDKVVKLSCNGINCDLNKTINSLGYFGLAMGRVGIFKDDELDNISDNDYNQTIIEFTVLEKDEEEATDDPKKIDDCNNTKEGCKEPIVTIPEAKISLSTDTATVDEPITAYVKFTSDLPVGYRVKIGNNDSNMNDIMSGGQKDWNKPLKTNSTGKYTVYYGLYNVNKFVKDLGSSSYTVNAKIVELLPPQNVKATTGSYDDKIKISWDKVDNATGYKIYRTEATSKKRSKATNDEEIADIKSTSYEDTKNIVAGKEYDYKVKAYDTKKVESPYSNSASGYMKEKVIELLPPKNVSATDGDGEYKDKIEISWDKVDNTTGYYVYRSLYSLEKYSKVSSISNNGTTKFIDRSAEYGIKYRYYVTSYNSSKESKESDDDKGYMELPAPKNLKVSQGAYQDKIKISWDKVDNSEKYYLYRSKSSLSDFTRIETLTSTSYSDFDIDNSERYYYKVKARNEETGNGNYSNIVDGYAKVEDRKEPVKTVDAKPTVEFINDIKYAQHDNFDIKVLAKDDIALKQMAAIIKYNGKIIKVLGKTDNIDSKSRTKDYTVELDQLIEGREYEIVVGALDSTKQTSDLLKKKFKVVYEQEKNYSCNFVDINISGNEKWWDKYVITLCEAGIVQGPVSAREYKYKPDNNASWAEVLTIIEHSADFSGTKETCSKYNKYNEGEHWSACYLDIAQEKGFPYMDKDDKVTRGLAFQYLVKAFWGVDLSEMTSYNWLASEGIIIKNNSHDNYKYIKRSELAKIAVLAAEKREISLGK